MYVSISSLCYRIRMEEAYSRKVREEDVESVNVRLRAESSEDVDDASQNSPGLAGSGKGLAKCGVQMSAR